MGEFIKKSKHYPLGDHFINSRDFLFWLLLLLWVELMFVTRSWGLIPTRQVLENIDFFKTLYKEVLED